MPPKTRQVADRESNRDSTLESWKEWQMKEAIQFWKRMREDPSYRGPKMGYKKCAKAHGVPRQTFHGRIVAGKLCGVWWHVAGGKGKPRIFTEAEEADLSNLIAKFSQCGFPFTLNEIHAIAFEYAKANDVKGFNEEKGVAGEKWARGFLRRQQANLTMRIPKLLSIYRAKCTNKAVVNHWFDIYENLLRVCQIESGTFVWNIDECGCIDTPRPKRVVCKARLRAHQLSYQDKGETTTVACFVNAAGMHLDPVVIHKGGKVSPGWRVDKPEGVMLSYSSNGWINKRIFYEYGQQFIRFLKDRDLLGPTRRHVLLMDSHSTHELSVHETDG